MERGTGASRQASITPSPTISTASLSPPTVAAVSAPPWIVNPEPEEGSAAPSRSPARWVSERCRPPAKTARLGNYAGEGRHRRAGCRTSDNTHRRREHARMIGMCGIGAHSRQNRNTPGGSALDQPRCPTATYRAEPGRWPPGCRTGTKEKGFPAVQFSTWQNCQIPGRVASGSSAAASAAVSPAR